jgi:hypothetical protein
MNEEQRKKLIEIIKQLDALHESIGSILEYDEHQAHADYAALGVAIKALEAV